MLTTFSILMLNNNRLLTLVLTLVLVLVWLIQTCDIMSEYH